MSTIENSAITSLLLKLDREEVFYLWTKRVVSQEIAMQCLKITKKPQQVRKLLQSEKSKIAFRGNDSADYLLNNNVTVEQILSFYFAHSVEVNEDRRVLHYYVTISELMLILGTFLEFMELRDRHQTVFKNDLLLARVEGLFHSKKIGGLEWKTVLKRELVREGVAMNYLQEQASTVMKSILSTLGVTSKETPKKQLKKICLASKELCCHSIEWVKFFENRNKYGSNAFGDLDFLEQLKEESLNMSLYSNLPEKEKQYKI